ncbi:MAG: hypothetical protein KF830_14155 [Planctomycetes bacterium]|nr:hypothetical protein [Planctomycetota bacterium]
MRALDFVPSHCPQRSCAAFRDPPKRFFRRAGSYQPQCRAEPIPRFVCKVCERGFSRQTFRLDYRDKRPHANVPLFQLLTSGVGLRQSARLVRLDVHAVQKKFRKLGRHMRMLNRNLLTALPAQRTLMLDELETFEHRSITPLTVPVLIDRDSKFVIATDVAPIRRVAKAGSWRRRWLESYEARTGRRRDRGNECVRRVLGRMQQLLEGRQATLLTDEKASYARQCRRRFGEQVVHRTVPSTLPRTVYNPLFAINLTDAMLRDNNGRLRRRSWLVSKRGPRLGLQLELFAAYRNWHRRRHNDDPADTTPGVVLQLCRRSLTIAELVAWRQDWRRSSIHPASVTGHESVGRWAPG